METLIPQPIDFDKASLVAREDGWLLTVEGTIDLVGERVILDPRGPSDDGAFEVAVLSMKPGAGSPAMMPFVERLRLDDELRDRDAVLVIGATRREELKKP